MAIVEGEKKVEGARKIIDMQDTKLADAQKRGAELGVNVAAKIRKRLRSDESDDKARASIQPLVGEIFPSPLQGTAVFSRNSSTKAATDPSKIYPA